MKSWLILCLIALPGWSAAAAAMPASVQKDLPYLEGGRSEKLDLYLPARDETDPPVPAVVWIHGEDAAGGDKAAAREETMGQLLAGAGYVCASINYRLGPGAWPTDLFDCKNAVRFLRTHAVEYHLDPNRIAAMGGSAGGHLALMLGLTAGEAGLEPVAPYPNVTSEVSAVGDFYGVTASLARQNGGPLNHINSDSPPVLIAQDPAEPAVDRLPSQELDRALSAKGVPHRLILLEQTGLTFDLGARSRPPLARELRPEVRQFLGQYVGVAAHGLPVSIPAPSPRIELNLDAGWRFFSRDHQNGSNPAVDDSKWAAVDLPHTWNAKDGQDGGGDYHRGPAWYRRHLTLDGRFQAKQLYLQFDGASLQADVYVNGKKLGTHLGGFARFRFDATDALHPGDNVVAVRVDNSALGIIPVTADFTFFGGLYRSVSLIATNQVQISMMDYGSPGVFVDQTSVSAQRADLVVRTEVENYEDKQRSIEVVTVILDASGHAVASAVAKQRMGAGDGFTAAQKISLSRPHLWNGRADPYLYTVFVTIRADGAPRDSLTQPLGLRSFRLDPEQGFMLNGHHLDLHGVNRHQDRIDEGWAITAADEAEDFALLKELGCTAFRASHYQSSDTWFQRLDRSGIVAWAELPFVGETLPAPEFLANAKEQLRELIRQNYNHPAICFWGVGNEVRDIAEPIAAKPVKPAPEAKAAKEAQAADGAKTAKVEPVIPGGAVSDRIVAELALLANSEDRGRLSGYASSGQDNEPKNWHTDVTDFNHYAGWSSGEAADLGRYLDDIHARHPSSPIGLGEYGAGASIFQHQLPAPRPAPNGRIHPEEYQAYLHEMSWAALAARPFVGTKFVCTLFDFASDGRNEGDQPGRNDKGLVTYDRRVRKDAYFFYKASWSQEPVVNLNSRRFLVRHRPATDIEVYSNAPEVELLLNGQSLGKLTGTNHVFVWKNQTLKNGENNVTARAQFGPTTVTDGCTWIYEPK